jgi:hypothetical protein
VVLLDTARPSYFSGSVYEQRYHAAGALLAEMRRVILAREQVPGGADEENDPGWLRTQLVQLTAELSAVQMREVALDAELRSLNERLEESERRRDRAERTLEDVKSSVSWTVTEPLRSAKRLAARRKA